MQNFWELLLVLSSLTGQHTIADIARLTNTTMELKINDEYVRFYESVTPIQLKLNSNIVMATVDVIDSKKYAGKPFYISLHDLRGVCLSRTMLKEHMTEFSFLSAPSYGLPNEVFSEQAKFNGKFVWLGFKLKNPECLSGIFLNFYNMDELG
jgi:hypothetical protein